MEVKFEGKATRYYYEQELDTGIIKAYFSEGHQAVVTGTSLEVYYYKPDINGQRISLVKAALGDDIEKALPMAESIVQQLIDIKAWEGVS